MDIWVGMFDVRPGPDGTGRAYAYGAARANTAAEAVAALGDEGYELQSVEWLARLEFILDERRKSEAVRGIVNLLGEGDGDAVLDYFFSYPDEDEPGIAGALKAQVDGFVEQWVDNAIEARGPFAFGDFAFVAEMRFEDDDELGLGWAYSGAMTRTPAFFARAAEEAARNA